MHDYLGKGFVIFMKDDIAFGELFGCEMLLEGYVHDALARWDATSGMVFQTLAAP